MAGRDRLILDHRPLAYWLARRLRARRTRTETLPAPGEGGRPTGGYEHG